MSDAPSTRPLGGVPPEGPLPPGAGAGARQRAAGLDIVLGLLLAFAWPAFLFATGFVAMGVGARLAVWDFAFVLLFAVGLSQIPYIAVVAVVAHGKRRAGIVQGVLIGAGIVFLLNGACWAFFLVTFAGGF